MNLKKTVWIWLALLVGPVSGFGQITEMQEKVGGNYATIEYFKAVEQRNKLIAEKTLEDGITLDGKPIEPERLNTYGFSMTDASRLWKNTSGGPVSYSLGLPIKQFMENQWFTTLQYFIVVIALTLSVITSLNAGRLFQEMNQWLVKAFPALFILFFPQLIYAVALGFANLATIVVGFGLNSTIGEDMQARLGVMGADNVKAASAYDKAYNRAVNQMALYFTTEDVNAQKVLNIQLNRMLKDIQDQDLLSDVGELPVEEIDEANLGQARTQAFGRLQQMAKVVFSEYPPLDDSNGRNQFKLLKRNHSNVITDPKEFHNQSDNADFNPFDDKKPPKIWDAASPVLYFKYYDPLVEAIRSGKRKFVTGKRSAVYRSIDEDDKEDFMERFEKGTVLTARAWYERYLIDPLLQHPIPKLLVAPAGGDAGTLRSNHERTAEVLQDKKDEIDSIKLGEKNSDKAARWVRNAVGSVAKFFMGTIMPLAIWMFSLMTELALLALWITVPLWFFKKTEKAFLGFGTLLITSAIYPAVLLVSVFIVDMLFAQVTRLVLDSGAAQASAGIAGGAGVATLATAVYTGGVGAVTAVLGTVLAAIIGYAVLVTAYVVAVALVIFKVPSITRKLMAGQLPIADFAQSMVGGALAGAGVGIAGGAPLAAAAAPALASGAASIGAGAANAGKLAAQGGAKAAAKVGGSAVKKRVATAQAQGKGVFSKKMMTGNRVRAAARKMSRSKNGKKLKKMGSIGGGAIKNATREVAAAVASGGDAQVWNDLRSTGKKDRRVKQGGGSNVGGMDDGSQEED